MHYMDPTYVAYRFCRHEKGYQFRANHINPKVLWGKLSLIEQEPAYGALTLYSRYIVLFDLAKPFLDATAHVPYDAPIEAVRKAVSESKIDFTKCMLDYQHLERTIEGMHKQLDSLVTEVVCKYYKLGATPKILCDIYQIGRTRVYNALHNRGLLSKDAVIKPGSAAYQAKNATLQQVRDDPRYDAFYQLDRRLRSRAKYSKTPCSYARESLLDMSSGSPVIPGQCPVFGYDLDYLGVVSNPDMLHDATPAITRYDPSKPYQDGNVLITCRLAQRLIDGTIGAIPRAKAFADPETVRAWAAWQEKMKERNT